MKKLKKIKIIILATRQFTIRDFHRFGAEYLIEKGYDVELWEIRSDDAKVICFSSGMYEGDNLHVYNPREIRKKVKIHADAYFLLYAGSEQSKAVMQAIAKYKCKYILPMFMTMYVLPKEKTQFMEEPFRKKALTVLKKGFRATALAALTKTKRIYNEKMVIYYTRVHLPICIICPTHEASKRLANYYQGCPIIYAHVFDYDRYLEMGDHKDETHEEYILYCDSGNGSIVGDYLRGNNYDPIFENRKYYFDQLEKVFTLLESYYNLPVVIAGHPHTIYDEKSFNGRKIEMGKTEELVKNAKIFVMMMTTAVNWAVLYNKNVLILYCNLLTKVANWETYIKPNIEVFEIEPCNMDREEMISQPWEYVKRINPAIRESYISKYMKEKGTPEKTVIELIEDIILEKIADK